MFSKRVHHIMRHVLAGVLCALFATAGVVHAQNAAVKISIAYWGNNNEAATTKQMIAAFEAANPDITVEQIWVQSDYEQKVTTMIAGGTAPDLMQISHTSLPGFADSFAPVTLDPTLYSSSKYVDALTYNGVIRAIPFVVKPKVMGINVDLFKAAGIPIPNLNTPMTPQDFQNLAIKLAKGDGQNRVFGSAPLWFGGWIFVFGNTFYNVDGTQVTIGDQSAIDAANFVINASTKYHYAPTAVESSGQDMFNWFLSGRVAMFPDFGPWNLPQVKQATKTTWELVPDPGKGEPTEIDGFGISKDTTQLKAATALATYLSQNDTAQNILGSSAIAVGVPVMPAAAAAFAKSVPDHNIAAFVLAATNNAIPVGNKMDAQIQAEFYKEINARTAIGTGSEDPAVVFPEVAKNLNAMFNQ